MADIFPSSGPNGIGDMSETPTPYIVGNVIYTSAFTQSYILRPEVPRYDVGNADSSTVTQSLQAFRKKVRKKARQTEIVRAI